MQLSNSRLFFEIDNESFDKVKKYKWNINDGGYVYASFGRNNHKSLHRFLLNLSCNDGNIVDHWDGNKLNNQISNLRICSNKQNSINCKLSSKNKSDYRGVQCKGNKFHAFITDRNSKKTYIGVYTDKILAARAVDKYLLIHHGEFGRLNFPIGHELFCKNNIDEYNQDFKTSSKTSTYRGVYKLKKDKKWSVKCGDNNYGRFDSEVEAAKAYNIAAIEKYGDKAKLNRIEE